MMTDIQKAELERVARTAKEMGSFFDYKDGEAIAVVEGYISEARKIADTAIEKLDRNHAPKERKERVEYFLGRYEKEIYDWVKKGYDIDCQCPSVLITGRGNFPVNKKNKQNAARDKHMRETPSYLLDKIRAIGNGAGTIQSDDENAVQRIKDKIAALESEVAYVKERNKTMKAEGKLDEVMPTWWFTNNNAEIRRLKERLLKLSPDDVMSGKAFTVNGLGTFEEIVGIWDETPIKPHDFGDKIRFYKSFAVEYSDGTRKYKEYCEYEVSEDGSKRLYYGNDTVLDDKAKFLYVISKANGSGNKAILHKGLADLMPKAEEPEAVENAEETVTIFGDEVRVERNKELQRLQLFFPGKPSEQVRGQVKHHGFRWSPTNGCWQRQLTGNAEFSLNQLVKEGSK